MEQKTQIQIINDEINVQLGDPKTMNALIATTFNGLQPIQVRQAIMEGMMRGFTFKNFLQKDIYAIPFKSAYSLVTSIDYSRKIGAKSGVVGVTEPVYEMDGSKIISCAITVKKIVSGYVGEFTARVYMKEYDKGSNLWLTKPRTMIAKVAEMHALRKACPEELAQSYIEEELELENLPTSRMNEAKNASNSLKMKNLKSNEENNKTEENQDGTTDAEGSQTGNFKESTITRD